MAGMIARDCKDYQKGFSGTTSGNQLSLGFRVRVHESSHGESPENGKMIWTLGVDKGRMWTACRGLNTRNWMLE